MDKLKYVFYWELKKKTSFAALALFFLTCNLLKDRNLKNS